MHDDDERWMTRAIEFAHKADYRTSPNPMVGAVVLDSAGKVAGEGFHAAKGSPHAEEMALAAAGAKAGAGTIYVNLEPCTHTHRSTPCAEAIVSAGIKRVVVAMSDPDERVRGAGIERLRSAGLRVDVGTSTAAADLEVARDPRVVDADSAAFGRDHLGDGANYPGEHLSTR